MTGNHRDDDLAPDALAALLPHLDTVVNDAVESVDGTNRAHSGHTFDFAAPRRDGTWLAIEVVRAWDEPFMAARRPWDAECVKIETAVRAQHPTITGFFTVNVDPASGCLPKDYDTAALTAAVVGCSAAGPRSRVEIAEGITVSNATLSHVTDLHVTATQSSGEFELGPQSQQRIARALASKIDVMMRAGSDGYETHLVMIPWVLASTDACRRYLEANPPATAHPQNIWAVDLNLRQGTQGRDHCELMWSTLDS
jgi:hypothetical protein